MNKFLFLLPLALLATVPHAQQSKTKLGFINVQAAVKAMPNSKAYLDLSAKIDKELQAKQKNLQTLATKAAATRSAADRQALTKAQQALVTSQNTYQQQLAKAFQPLASKLNAAVAKTAKANGYSVVLDQRVAAQSSLVVYANPTTDLTNAVIKALK